jgi:hypothetical protein
MTDLSKSSAADIEQLRLENQRKQDALREDAFALKVAHDVALKREAVTPEPGPGDATANAERT